MLATVIFCMPRNLMDTFFREKERTHQSHKYLCGDTLNSSHTKLYHTQIFNLTYSCGGQINKQTQVQKVTHKCKRSFRWTFGISCDNKFNRRITINTITEFFFSQMQCTLCVFVAVVKKIMGSHTHTWLIVSRLCDKSTEVCSLAWFRHRHKISL